MGVLYIYNSLSKKKEKFEPLEYPFVKIYHCGITPYDRSHVGHLRSETSVDVLRRTLRFLGYIDIAISNFTDIDDKIIRKARETEKDWSEIAIENIKYHLKIVSRINNLPFYVNPKVTEHIPDMVEFIEDLIKKGYAYSGKYGIYFNLDKFKDYGKLSGKKDPNSWRQEEEFLSDKMNPYDFVLWKFKREGEPYWETSIGPGRPGWHIECSTMSSKYLGEKFDIHTGGQDLIFPHHENEIAQSEARFSHDWVKYWIHFGLVYIEGEKMSKSLGNVIEAGEFLDKYGEMPSRFYLISTHYRDILNITEEGIQQAIDNYKYITSTIKTIISELEKTDRTFKLSEDKIKIWNTLLTYEKKFINSILDDIDTTRATAILLEATKFINKEIINSGIFTLLYTSYEFYRIVNNIYACWDDIFYKKEDNKLVYNLLDLILEIRKELRKRKQYDLSDKIREKLRNIGIDLLDRGEETFYRFI
ncbi:MAG: cysteine--tRNA ligase [Nanopusillaceae archaeon]